jgi:uncharacterized protein YndB with AHSA1/START domain
MKNDDLEVKVQLVILKPAHQIFEAIVDPEKMSNYFISWGSDRIEAEKNIDWRWDDVGVQLPVKVQQVVQNTNISFFWSASGVEALATFELEPVSEESTIVKISESSWPADSEGIARCLGQTQGWTHLLCCLKAYLEYGINLRIGGIVRTTD